MLSKSGNNGINILFRAPELGFGVCYLESGAVGSGGMILPRGEGVEEGWDTAGTSQGKRAMISNLNLHQCCLLVLLEHILLGHAQSFCFSHPGVGCEREKNKKPRSLCFFSATHTEHFCDQMCRFFSHVDQFSGHQLDVLQFI